MCTATSRGPQLQNLENLYRWEEPQEEEFYEFDIYFLIENNYYQQMHYTKSVKTLYLLFTVDCHQQIYRIFAVDSRLSPANICYWQSTVTSKFTEYLLLTVDCHQPLRFIL